MVIAAVVSRQLLDGQPGVIGVGESNTGKTPAGELESGSTSSGGRANADRALALPVPGTKPGMLGAKLGS